MGRTKRTLSLRRALGVTLAVLAILTGCSSGALVVLTSMLLRSHDATLLAVEREQMIEDSQRDLLLRHRAARPELRDRLATDILDRMRRVHSTARDPDELDASERAEQATRALLGSGAPGGDVEAAAHEAIRELDLIERAKVDDARARARAIDDVANIVGIGTGLLASGGFLATLLWLNRRVIRPLLHIATRIRAYGRGDSRSRAVEEGPRELGDMARAFNTTADRLEEQRAAHATLLAGVAHDLRNPIHVLSMAVDLAGSADARTERSSQTERVLGVVQRQLPRLERLAADLLDSAALEAGRLELELADHDLRDIASSTAALFRSTSKNHDVLLDVPQERVVACCDAHRIEQVVVNLVGNAIKYSPEGGAVRISVRGEDEKAIIEVEDQGIGMTCDQAKNVFEPFARADSLRDSVPGHGLGLFIAERIVRDHHGSIHVDSTEGRGSVFCIELPTRRSWTTASFVG